MQELIREYYTLEDGTKVPKIGFGCYNPRKQDYVTIIKTAIDAGYRYFDTASLYETERDLARALKESGIDRKEVQIASKAWYDELGYEETKAAFNRTLERLETDYLDFYMLHWPKASEDDPDWKEKDRGAWKALTVLWNWISWSCISAIRRSWQENTARNRGSWYRHGVRWAEAG